MSDTPSSILGDTLGFSVVRGLYPLGTSAVCFQMQATYLSEYAFHPNTPLRFIRSPIPLGQDTRCTHTDQDNQRVISTGEINAFNLPMRI